MAWYQAWSQLMMDDCPAMLADAIAAGRQIDLSGCDYGQLHRDGRFARGPRTYYFFLAGLVRAQRLTRVLELGTHFGGAILAMSRGLRENDLAGSCLVTVDVADKNPTAFRGQHPIVRIIGDALGKRTRRRVLGCFDRPVDLLFIDAGHDYRQVMTCLAIYANALQPRYIVLDDIRLNASMDRLWRVVSARAGLRAWDISCQVGRERVGFGVLECSEPVRWMENYSRWVPYWRLKRAVSPLVPGPVKGFLERRRGSRV